LTAGLQRPAKKKGHYEHVTGSDVAVISRKHSDINLLSQKKKLSARACVLGETQTAGLPEYKPDVLLLVQSTASSRTNITLQTKRQN